MRPTHTLLFGLTGLAMVLTGAAAGPAAAKAPKKGPKVSATVAPKARVGPVPASEAKSAHAPFEMGECSLCHVGDKGPNPGALNGPLAETCFQCHEDLQGILDKGQYKHKPAQDNCIGCHNPHNSREEHLLNAKSPDICLSCHSGIAAKMKLKVDHLALTRGDGCANCHSPHASNIEHLLTALPFDLCVNCHAKDNMAASDGRAMTNFKQLLADNPQHHSPVEEKDCSACHLTHGGDNFRLLTHAYPEQFYEDWDVKKYQLCFECHDSEAFTAERTTTATKFRDGDLNLHFKHVNKERRGRTCRACHEVHASPQVFQIRDGVPFGKKGWVLKLNYEQTKKGGSCSKTCHKTLAYDNTRTTAKAGN